MTEETPTLPGVSEHSNIDSLRRKTMTERALIVRRERAVKGLAELCVLRCVRPDLLSEAMSRFVTNLLDPSYVDMKGDILIPLAAKKGKLSAAELPGASASPSKKGASQHSVRSSLGAGVQSSASKTNPDGTEIKKSVGRSAGA